MQESEAAHAFDQEYIVLLLGDLMKKAGVEGLPQNYALFYHAHVGSDQELRARLEEICPNPDQGKLDELFRSWETDPAQMAIVDGAHGRVMKLAGEIMDLLAHEQSSLEKYVELLGYTASGITEKKVGQEILNKIADILSSATNITLNQSLESAETMGKRSAELQEIRRELEAYKNLADTDDLTKLWNRRAFNRGLTQIYKGKMQRFLSSLILVDIDRFKDLNDRHGHLAGDHVLQQVAAIMKSKCGAHISLFRVGGEEFALIVEGLGDTSTVELAERVRKAVEAHLFSEIAADLSVTISAGICKASDASSPDDLFAKADSALYASKAKGRNRVTSYPVPYKVHERKNWMLYRDE